jgi:hypothetical protein
MACRLLVKSPAVLGIDVYPLVLVTISTTYLQSWKFGVVAFESAVTKPKNVIYESMRVSK